MRSAAEAVSVRVKLAVGNASSPWFATARWVLFGTVVLCGGQSNMVHPVTYDYNATAQLAAATLFPNLRLFRVGRQWSNNGSLARSLPLGCSDTGTTPPLTPNCTQRNRWWSAADGGAGGAGSFSAVCYLTAQELMRAELGADTAVGLVEVDWGGSNQHAWQTRAHAQRRGCPVAPVPDGRCALEERPLSPIGGTFYGCLFHGMVEPLAQSLRPALALWYQGESNAMEDPSDMFLCQFEAMIDEWRGAFNRSRMPFFAVQLAPYYQPPCRAPNTPVGCGGIGTDFPHIRVAQAAALDAARASTGAPSGYAVTHDIGDVAGGIHPHNKTEVARRLALAIRTQVFGAVGLPQVSVPDAAAVLGPQQLELGFNVSGGEQGGIRWGPTHNCSSCCSTANQVVEACGAANCTSDNAWTNLSAVAAGSTLRIQLGDQQPRLVRYAWSNFPQCVLYDRHSLPVGPFVVPVLEPIGL